MKHASPHAAFSSAPIGVGLRAPHMAEVLAGGPAVDFFEVHPENFFLDKGALAQLETIRADYPLSFHAVGISLGSAEGIDATHLARVAELVERLQPVLVSDHLSWSVTGGVYLNDLLPLPYTDEALKILAHNIDVVQDALGRSILIENPSAYIRFEQSAMSEPEFLRALVLRTGCGLLLDVNNVHVSAHNLGFDARAYLRSFPVDAVREIHVAGHSTKHVNGLTILIDDHGSSVSSPVLSLYAESVARAPHALSLVEWDSDIPDLAVLLDERDTLRRVQRKSLGNRQPEGLKAIQSRLAKALMGEIRPDAMLDVTGFLSVHRNNIRLSLTRVLQTVYAGTSALVGPDFFDHCAQQFITVEPPRMPSLAGYGAGFGDFLEKFPACARLPYLPDVARLEWLASRAQLELWQNPLEADALTAHISCDSQALHFGIQQSARYLASQYPVDDIWRFARADGAGEAPILDGTPIYLEVSRDADGVVLRRLEPAEFEFRRSLGEGADLGEAADTAFSVDPLFDLAVSLRSALRDGLFTHCYVEQPEPEEIKL